MHHVFVATLLLILAPHTLGKPLKNTRFNTKDWDKLSDADIAALDEGNGSSN
jgi:hypothetical protein